MADGLKSTLDLAMEKTDKMIGKEIPALTDDQKRRIAETRRECEAKIAEKKILLAGSEELTAELQKVHREKEEKIEKIYGETKGSG